ncbi:hypothetical protein [Rhodococcus aetherivorans]|uniref:zinc finger domain-containing protein n=1 Tax=Rhodococcus aetherivorans TaxID=191292 RepID=UPI00045C646F|nr:hypothetical protein [Rhodococcus aetherivorans]KDE14234.1 hypothetical protein N505_0105285 [Rhodococcus aetherivorans]
MTLTRDDVIDILTAIAAYDRRTIGEGDIAAWGAALRPDLDRQLAIEAVRIHNATSEDWIKPVHVNKLAVDIRKDRADREDREAREARQLDNDTRHGLVIDQDGTALNAGLSINADGPPVPGAYQVNDAVERDCPTCKAEPYEPCTNRINGNSRRMPCTARLKDVSA